IQGLLQRLPSNASRFGCFQYAHAVHQHHPQRLRGCGRLADRRVQTSELAQRLPVLFFPLHTLVPPITRRMVLILSRSTPIDHSARLVSSSARDWIDSLAACITCLTSESLHSKDCTAWPPARRACMSP